MPRWQHSSTKCAPFERRFREQDAVVGDDPDGIAEDMGEAADQRRAVKLLELVELRAVHDAGDHLAHVERLAGIGRDDAVEVFRRIQRVGGLPGFHPQLLRPVQMADDPPRDAERMGIVEGVVVGDARSPAMDIGAAQILRRDDLARRGLHQRRAAEKDGALVADDDRLVRHRRDIGAARRAASHHDGDLGNALRRHVGLIEEDPAEMVAVRKHLVLVRQVGPAAVHQIDAGQVVLLRDLLRPQVLLDRQRVIGAALHRGVVGDDDAFPPRHPADAGQDAGRRDLLLIDAVGRKLGQFQIGRAGIEQCPHPVARQQLAAREVPVARPRPSALLDLVDLVAQIGDQRRASRRHYPRTKLPACRCRFSGWSSRRLSSFL